MKLWDGIETCRSLWYYYVYSDVYNLNIDAVFKLYISIICLIVGGYIGGLLGFLVPFFIAQIYVATGGDPTGGAFFVLTFFTIPIGLIGGGILGFQVYFSKFLKKIDDNR